MGGGLFGSFFPTEAKVTDIEPLTWAALSEGFNSKAGVSVSLDRATRVTAFLACVRVLAEGIAQLPLKIYREGEDGSLKPATDLDVYRVLHRKPNEFMTSFEFRETMMMHATMTGQGRAFINRIGGEESPKIAELLPILPGRCAVKQSAGYETTYEITSAKGESLGTFPRSAIFEIRGPSWDGVCGMQPLDWAREALGLAIATEETHSRLHANGAQPGGVLSVDGNLSIEAAKRLKEDWAQSQVGGANKWKTALLPGNVKWQALSETGVDNQHLELRRFQVEEICRALRVFPQMIGYADKTATFASAEAFFLAHVVHSLVPWVERWQQAIARDLLGDDMTLQAKFAVQGLLRGDAKTRAAFYASGIVNGWLTRNQARLFEEMNPIDGLDEPLIPLNMGTAAERDEIAEEVVKTIKSHMIGHNGGPALDDADGLEEKIGRVLSRKNEDRIVNAHKSLAEVLASLPTPGEEQP